MSKHVGHLFEADPTPDHLCCGCVPERVCAQPADRNPSEFEMSLRDATNGTATGNRAERRAGAEEKKGLHALGSTVPHVFCEGFANIVWQRQLSFPRRFRGVYSNLPFSPIDIGQTKAAHFPGPQREPNE